MYGIGLVVPQADVEARLVLLDEVLLGQQRLGLGVDDQRLDLIDHVDQIRCLRACSDCEKCEATRLRIDFALPT